MLLNTVFKSKISEKQIRVVLEQVDHIQVIDIDDGNAWPKDMIVQELLDGFIEIPDPTPPTKDLVGSVAVEKRDKAYSVIEPLLSNYQDLFTKRLRNQLIKDRLEEVDYPRLYITRQLRRYWQNGMTPNALLPDYENCGGKGKARRTVDKKLGRNRKTSNGVGLIVTDEVAELFDLAIALYSHNSKFPFTDAHDKANALYKSRYPSTDDDNLSTIDQLRYYFKRHYKRPDITKSKTPKINYQKDIRPLISTATNLNHGPGARYEIDATSVDLYILSNVDREKIIGRPTLYFVKDVFSRMIVGLYVGLENPSWVAAMIALANAFSDKKEFCKQYGINIETSEWPSIGLPASIHADRAELLFHQSDVVVNRFGITISNSRSRRGDDKGTVERQFNTTHARLKPYVAGVVEPINGKKRLGKRYELDAELNLEEFTRLIVKLVLHQNMNHVVRNYDFSQDMPTDLPAVPIQLWNWGIKNRTGQLRICDAKLAYINLLPTVNCNTSEVGINVNGLYFTCSSAVEEGWFDRKNATRPKKVEVAFDPRSVNKVYVRFDSSFENYWEGNLSDQSRRFRDMSFAEANILLSEARKADAGANQKKKGANTDHQKDVEELVAKARSNKPKFSSQSNAARLRGIRDNRNDAKNAERKANTPSIKPRHEAKEPTAQVISITKSRTKKLDYIGFDDLYGDDD